MNAASESESAGRTCAAAHARSVAVWGVPTAIQSGETFRIQVGVKCTAECRPQGWRVEIYDEGNNVLAAATLGDGTWPGTTALYHAEIELTAPAAEGLHAWQAVALASSHDVASVTVARDGSHMHAQPDEDVHARAQAQHIGEHDETRANFNVRAVRAPECRVTVAALDRESRMPIADAKVCVHPYRALTDARGVAEVLLPKGQYRLFVSGRDYLPARIDGDVHEDVTIEAELDVDRSPSDADLWS